MKNGTAKIKPLRARAVIKPLGAGGFRYSNLIAYAADIGLEQEVSNALAARVRQTPRGTPRKG